MINIPKKQIKLLEVQSHVSGDLGSAIEPPHWDICFLYEVKLPKDAEKKLKQPKWFEDLSFKSLSSLAPDGFTRSHDDVLELAGLISRRSKE